MQIRVQPAVITITLQIHLIFKNVKLAGLDRHINPACHINPAFLTVAL